MQIIRTLIWILVTVVLVAFVAMNWERAPVNIWPLEAGYLYFQWPVGIIAVVFLLLGLLPMWLIHRASVWRLQRRITSLEHSVRTTAIAPPPLATTNQLDAQANPEEPTS